MNQYNPLNVIKVYYSYPATHDNTGVAYNPPRKILNLEEISSRFGTWSKCVNNYKVVARSKNGISINFSFDTRGNALCALFNALKKGATKNSTKEILLNEKSFLNVQKSKINPDKADKYKGKLIFMNLIEDLDHLRHKDTLPKVKNFYNADRYSKVSIYNKNLINNI